MALFVEDGNRDPQGLERHRGIPGLDTSRSRTSVDQQREPPCRLLAFGAESSRMTGAFRCLCAGQMWIRSLALQRLPQEKRAAAAAAAAKSACLV
jgi:hypothetical protein